MSASSSQAAIPDQALLRRFAAGDGAPMAGNSNPLATALGCRILRVDVQAGEVELAYEPGALFVQGTGVLQGGAVSAMLDFAMAYALMAKLPEGSSCATASMSTSFLLPAPQGAYRASGYLERAGRTLAFARAELRRAHDGAVVATATSTLAVVGRSGT